MGHRSTVSLGRRPRCGLLAASALVSLALASCTHTLEHERPPRPPLPPSASLNAEESARRAGDEHDKLVVTEEHLNDDHSIIDEAGVMAAETQPARTDGVTHLGSAGPAFVVQSGKSRLVELDRPVRRVSVGDPEVAEIILVSPRDILINGRRPGDTSLILWDQQGVSEVH